jgi:hypothetical protein
MPPTLLKLPGLLAEKVWVKTCIVKPDGEKPTAAPLPPEEVAVPDRFEEVRLVNVTPPPVIFANALSNVRPFFKVTLYEIVPERGAAFDGTKPNWA